MYAFICSINDVIELIDVSAASAAGAW